MHHAICMLSYHRCICMSKFKLLCHRFGGRMMVLCCSFWLLNDRFICSGSRHIILSLWLEPRKKPIQANIYALGHLSVKLDPNSGGTKMSLSDVYIRPIVSAPLPHYNGGTSFQNLPKFCGDKIFLKFVVGDKPLWWGERGGGGRVKIIWGK